MKVLRLHLYQPTANYRPHFATATRNTYPLPPPSSVLGLIHKILKMKEGSTYREKGETIEGINLCILGKYQSMNWDYQWFLIPTKKAREINVNLFTSSLSLYKGKTFIQMPLKVQILSDVELLIYISLNEKAVEIINNKFGISNNEIEYALEKLKELFLTEHENILYLGRAEDLLIVQKKLTKIIEVNKTTSPPNIKDYSMWVPVDKIRDFDIFGPIYNLPGYYEKKKVKLGKGQEMVIRDFNWHPCMYVEPQELGYSRLLKLPEVYVDKELNMPLWFIFEE